MERLLLLWDELDDLTGVFRHVAASAAGELASLSAPVAAVASALGAGLLGAGLLGASWPAHAVVTYAVSGPWLQ